MSKIVVLSLVFTFIIRIRFPSHKSIAKILTDRYGRQTLKMIRKLETIDFKKKKAALDLEFLDNCVKHNLTPTFVQFKVSNRSLRASRAYKHCQQKLLHQEIISKKAQIKSLNKQFNQWSSQIRQTVSFFDSVHTTHLFTMKNDRLMDRIRLTQGKKLVKLGLRTATLFFFL